MQKKKDEIRNCILKTAKNEFLEYGFEKASIRKITSKAKISKSNLYNYFDNKDDLFCQVVKPTIDLMKQALEFKQKEYSNKKPWVYTMENQKRIIEIIMEFVYKNKDDFLLLVYKSKGSSYENFLELINEEFTNILLNWLDVIKGKRKISRFFVKSVAGFYTNTIAQVILKKLSKEEIDIYFNEFLHFVYGGWSNIFDNIQRK